MKDRRIPFVIAALLGTALVAAQRNSPPSPPLPANLFSADYTIRVSAAVTGLSHPWSLAFLPDGSMLITERAGRLRIARNGVLDPTPISGVPPVHTGALAGLLEVALHPKFAENHYVYLSYSKDLADKKSTTALARGKLEGNALVDVKEIFVANTASISNTNFGGRIVFDRDGMLFLTVGERQEQDRAQKGDDHGGKVLRLHDDGTVPKDNPYIGKAGFLPEIYAMGVRSPQGLTMNPTTGQIWENEHGPLGGDEVNIILPGRNYGWPLVTYGTDYDGSTISKETTRPDLESPYIYFVPSLALSGMMFYTGDRFPMWKGNLFVGSMMEGRTRGTGHLRRITINDKGRPIQREPLLSELHQRIRDVRQGPDGFIYVMTDEDAAAVLRLEPVAR